MNYTLLTIDGKLTRTYNPTRTHKVTIQTAFGFTVRHIPAENEAQARAQLHHSAHIVSVEVL